MTTYYVDSAALAGGTGLTQSAPINSLTAVNALNLAPGDSVLFKAGSSFTGSTPWTGILNVSAVGTADRPITIGTYGTGAAPTFGNIDTQWSSTIAFKGASYVVLQGISVVNGMQAGITLDGSTSHVTIQNVDISNAGTGVIMDGTANAILNSSIHDLKMVVDTPTSVNNNDDYGATAVIISGTGHVISGNQVNNAIAQSYDYGVDGGAFEFWQSASNVHIYNNVVTNSAGFMEMGGQPGTFSNIVVDHNNSYNSGTFAVIHNGGGAFGATISGIKVTDNTIVNTNNAAGSMSTVWLDGPATAQQFQFSNNAISLNAGDSVFEQHGDYHFNNVFDLKSSATHLYNNWDMTLNSGETYATIDVAQLSNGNVQAVTGTGTNSTSGIAMSTTPVAPQAPVNTAQISEQVDKVGKAFSLNVQGNFSDPNGDALTYTATQANGVALPSWLHFSSGTFSGTPAAGDTASMQIKVTASDSSHLTVSDTFGLTIAAASAVIGPVVQVTDQKPVSGSTVQASQLFTATDATGTIQAYQFVDWWNTSTSGHFVLSGVSQAEASTFQISASDLANLKFFAGSSHDLVAVRAFDGVSWSAWGTFNVDPKVVNQAPTVGSQIADQQDTVGKPFSLKIGGNFTDPNGDALTYSATQANGAALPAWLHFSGGTFSGTPGAGDVGSLQIKVTASDPLHLTASDTFDLSVASSASAAGPSSNTIATTPVATSLTALSVKAASATTLKFSDLVSLQGSPAEIKFVDWWTTPGSGHFELNGVTQAKGVEITISANQVSALRYVVGASGAAGQDTLQFQASNDGGHTWGTNGTDWGWATVSIVPL
jgi:hypothetical protein